MLKMYAVFLVISATLFIIVILYLSSIIATPRQSVTFWYRYWSRDRSRDHFGLENGLETSLVTLGSVTFWSQNGLETGSRPFWSQKWSRDLVSSLSAV